MRRRRYPSDLTDPQWALLVLHIPPAKEAIALGMHTGEEDAR